VVWRRAAGGVDLLQEVVQNGKKKLVGDKAARAAYNAMIKLL
jgi:hypothetical protein